MRKKRNHAEETPLVICDDFIKLGQAMKLAGVVGSGTDAKRLIQEGAVKVNGKTELHRGRKLAPGDVFMFQKDAFRIEK